MHPSVSTIGPVERTWILENLARAKRLVQRYHGGGPQLRPLALDRCYEQWLRQHEPAVEDPNPKLVALGTALGQILVDDLDLVWLVEHDQDDVQFSVFGQRENIQIYPINLVAARYPSRELGIFKNLYYDFKSQVKAARAAHNSGWKFW